MSFLYLLSATVDIFFKTIQIAGVQNVPMTGPVIFVCAPHANQFLDPIVVMKGIKRKDIGFLAAAVTVRKKYIGAVARAMGSIPVERPQDVKFSGLGKVTLHENIVDGDKDTSFTKQLTEGSTIVIGEVNAVILTIESDSKAVLKKEVKQRVELTDYKIIPKLDQEEVFALVANRLLSGGAIGIFPEGGSHDRTDLLPLKAGVTIMALTALAQNPSLPIKIVPCGLNYFHGHKFRSQAYLDIGEPMSVSPEILAKYQKGNKRDACGDLLEEIKKGLYSVITTAPDYKTLELFWTLRQIYTSTDHTLSTEEKVKITRRFSRIITSLADRPEIIELMASTREYLDSLHAIGMNDHQVINSDFGYFLTFFLLIYRYFLLIFYLIFMGPGLLLGAPVIYMNEKVATQKAAEAKKGSSVKIAGRDVMATWKVITSVVVVPVFLMMYFIIFTVLMFVFDIHLGPLPPIALSLIYMVVQPFYFWIVVKVGDALQLIYSSVPGLRVMIFKRKDSRHMKEMRITLIEKLTKTIEQYKSEFAKEEVTPVTSPSNARKSSMIDGFDWLKKKLSTSIGDEKTRESLAAKLQEANDKLTNDKRVTIDESNPHVTSPPNLDTGTPVQAFDDKNIISSNNEKITLFNSPANKSPANNNSRGPRASHTPAPVLGKDMLQKINVQPIIDDDDEDDEEEEVNDNNKELLIKKNEGETLNNHIV